MSGSGKDTDSLTEIAKKNHNFLRKNQSTTPTLPQSRSKCALVKVTPDISIDSASLQVIISSIDVDEPFNQYDRIDNLITKLKHKEALSKVPFAVLDEFVKKIRKIIPKLSNIEYSKNYKSEAKSLIKILEPSKTYLNLVSTRIVDQRLIVDEVLEKILKTTQSALDKLIIPLAHHPNKENFKVLESKKLKRCMASLCGVVEYFSTLISKKCFQENLVISLAELLIKTLFAEGAEILHLTCSYTLASIVHSYNKMTVQVINEIINNLLVLTSDPNLAIGAKSKKVHCREYTVAEGVEIKFSTFMVISVLQNFSSLSEALRLDGKVNLKLVNKQIQETLGISQHFVNEVCERAFKVKSESQEYRTFLDCFIQDLLKLIFRPEFPLAFQVLNLVIIKIFAALKTFSAVIRHYAIDEMALIASSLKQTIHEIKKLPIVPQNITKVSMTSHPSDNLMASICICKEGWSDEKCDMIQCEECWKWFHLDCVGLNLEKYLDNTWFCDDCRLFQYLQHISIQEVNFKEEEMFALPLEIISVSIQFQRVYQELIINYLISNGGRMEESSRSLWLAHWLSEKEDQNLVHLWQTPSKSPNLPRLSEKGTIKLLRQYLLAFDLGLTYLHTQHRIISLLTAVQPLTRAKAIKSLSAIVTADPECLLEDIIEAAVTERLNDTSIAVREATVELIGKFITYKSEFSDSYFTALMERLKDKGPSVRRRVIRILKDIISNDPENERRIEIYCEVIKRIGDDSEGIRDAVVGLFEEVWFSAKTEKFFVSFLQTIKVLKIKEPIIMLFKAILEKDQKYKDALEKITQTATEQLIASNLLGNSILCAKLIEIVSMTAPELLIDQITTLHQFLTASQSTPEESELLTSICIVIGQSSEHLSSLSVAKVKRIENQLITLVYTQSSSVVTQAISALCKIVRLCSRNHSIVTSLITKCFTLLKGQPKIISGDKNNLSSVFRALLALGLCIKYYESSIYNEFSLEEGIDFKTSIFDVYQKFSLMEDESIRERALDSLSLTWVRFPELIIKSDSLIKKAWQVANKANKKIKLLQMFYEFMRHCNEAIKEGSDEDKGNVVSVIYGYLDNILECTKNEKPDVRESAAEVLKLIFIQGTVNASKFVSVLFCMLGDESMIVREAAYFCVEKGFIKSPDLITINLQSSLKESFEFQCKILKQRDLKESYYSKVYGLIKGKKSVRNKMLNTILHSLEPNDPDFTEYLCEMISLFVYSTMEEVCLILQYINGKIQASAFRLLRIIKVRKINKETLNRDYIIECVLQIQLIILKNHLLLAYQIKSFDEIQDKPVQRNEEATLFQEEYEEFKCYNKIQEIKDEDLNKFKYKVMNI